MINDELVIYKESAPIEVFEGRTLLLDGSYAKPGIYRIEIIHRLVFITEAQSQMVLQEPPAFPGFHKL
jgi:hypothetical protein